MLDPNTPLMLSDGTSLYEMLSKKYKKHDSGLFILAPSGTGKTHYIKNHPTSDWIDGDELWAELNAHPNNAWWEAGDAAPTLRSIDFQSDLITMHSRNWGFWIMGASNLFLMPDAAVLPEWELHKSYISARETNNYDGGATTDRLQQVIEHRERIKQHVSSPIPSYRSLTGVEQLPAPIFNTIEEAVRHLTC